MPEHLDHLFYKYVGIAMERQFRLQEFIENEVNGPWRLDPRAGTLVLGDQPPFDIQVLGSLDSERNTWMWGSANPYVNYAEQALKASRAIQEYGETHNIEQFASNEILHWDEFFGKDLEGVVLGHGICCIALGLLDYDAFFPGEGAGGATYVLIQDERLRENVPEPLLRVCHMFQALLDSYPIHDHRSAFCGYLGRCPSIKC